MIARVVLQAISLGITAAGCVLLPYWGIRALWPVLEGHAPAITNYRGRRITYGVGLVMLLWAAGTFMAGALQNVLVEIVRAATAESDPLRWLVLGSAWPARAVHLVALVACAFGFGLVDDLFGDRSDRGFRGHLGALARGRLTTGSLKMLGIGAVSAFAATNVVNSDVASKTGAVQGGVGASVAWVGAWVLATAVVALCANMVNLMDLRPGRALKVYLLLAVAGVLGMQAPGIRDAFTGPRDLFGAVVAQRWIEWGSSTFAGLLVALGPFAAAWRLDVSERSMLGDAGANAAGVLAGYLLASSLSLPGLAVAAVLLLFINLASERVSFSEAVESSAMLRWLDGLGRAKEEGEGPGGTEAPGGSGTTAT